MYGKFINNEFIRARYGISEQEALATGFKPVVLTPAPDTDDEHYPEEWLEETQTEIIRHWNVKQFSPQPLEPTEEDYAAAGHILMGEGDRT